MATYFVSGDGSNTAPYDTWANAATSLQTALTAATAAGDIVVINKNSVPSTDSALSADTTYTINNSISIVSAVPDGESGWIYTPMGTDTWIGHNSLNRSIAFSGLYRVTFYGLTLRTAGSTADNINLRGAGNGSEYTYIDCYFWHGNTGVSYIQTQAGNSVDESCVRAINCTFRFGATGQTLQVGGNKLYLENCTISSAGARPSTLFGNTVAQANVVCVGCDFSYITGTLVGNFVNGGGTVLFDRCQFASGVTVMASQGSVSTGAAVVTVIDCADADNHYNFGYFNAFGSLVAYTSTYANDGASYDGTNKYSWRIDTTANASKTGPFVTPLIGMYSSERSVTPYIEALRTDSTTRYSDDELWIEVHAKTNSGNPQAAWYSDRCIIGATPAAQPEGIGTSNWTGAGSTPASMRLGLNSAINIAEIGELSARVCFAVPSATIYIDPQIRT